MLEVGWSNLNLKDIVLKKSHFVHNSFSILIFNTPYVLSSLSVGKWWVGYNRMS